MYVYSVAIVMVVGRGGRLCLMRVGVSIVGHVLTCEGEPPELPPMEIPDSLLASSSICMEPKPATKRQIHFVILILINKQNSAIYLFSQLFTYLIFFEPLEKFVIIS